MLDIAFSEMIVIGVVALVVIGPEKLPKVARTAGVLLGRAQKYVGDIKTDISRQIQLEELKAMQDQMTRQARELESSMKSQLQTTESALNQTAQGIADDLNSAGKTALEGPEATVAQLTAKPVEDELYHPDKPHLNL